jgi:hypothetical protein
MVRAAAGGKNSVDGKGPTRKSARMSEVEEGQEAQVPKKTDQRRGGGGGWFSMMNVKESEAQLEREKKRGNIREKESNRTLGPKYTSI